MAGAALDFARGEAARNAPPYVTAAAAECFATLWARGYVDACAADAHDAAVRRGRDAVVAVAAAGGAAIVATTLSCLLAELSGVGRTHLGVARARAPRRRGGLVGRRWRRGGAVACRCVGGVREGSSSPRERERWRGLTQKHTGAVAFGLVSQAAQHAKATGTIPSEATNAALLCESAPSPGTRATRRRTRGSVVSGRLARPPRRVSR